MSQYRLTPQAERDLDDIADYLFAQGGTGLVGHVMGTIEQAMEFLGATPGAGHARSDLTAEPVRFWPVFSYLIVYSSEEEPIGIARVLHGAQDLATILRHNPPSA